MSFTRTSITKRFFTNTAKINLKDIMLKENIEARQHAEGITQFIDLVLLARYYRHYLFLEKVQLFLYCTFSLAYWLLFSFD